MKLNMIVVMTMWLPRFACRIAGMNAHAAPNSAAPIIAAGSATPQCGHGSASATSATPSPPSVACPSAPMLNSPAWLATATASAVKMKFVA